MAGNIIPAIATTNAIIAGLIVMEGLKVISEDLESCRTVSPHILLSTCDARALGSVCDGHGSPGWKSDVFDSHDTELWLLDKVVVLVKLS